MATINSKGMVDRLIANNGHYEDGDSWKTDPGADDPVLRITEYQNGFNGAPAWGLCYPPDPIDKYAASDFVINPHVIFEHVPHVDCNHPAGQS